MKIKRKEKGIEQDRKENGASCAADGRRRSRSKEKKRDGEGELLRETLQRLGLYRKL